MKLELEDIIVIKDNNLVKYGFLALSKETCFVILDYLAKLNNNEMESSDFIDKFGISNLNFISIGDVTNCTSKEVGNYIDYVDIKENENSAFKKSYKCFCGEPHGLNYKNTILHPTALSSWECLINHLGNIKYGIIIDIKKLENEKL